MLKFTLSGNVVPKARPKFHGKTAYLPDKYRQWKEVSIPSIREQIKSQNVEIFDKPVKISISFLGISKRGDLDNLAGAILDVLVNAEIIKDDRINIVKQLKIEYRESKQKATYIEISHI